ncbi:MAG: hypothetical protein C9356_11710 [Oleiphilus sp.]|nr:MAG: hypothetical protein C9356_11710 [Oleiphilus sp.]
MAVATQTRSLIEAWDAAHTAGDFDACACFSDLDDRSRYSIIAEAFSRPTTMRKLKQLFGREGVAEWKRWFIEHENARQLSLF